MVRPIHNAATRVLSAMIVLAIAIVGTTADAKDGTKITGWEKDSPYNKLYNFKERDALKGRVVKFVKVTPMAGMAPGTAFIIDEGDDDRTLVHLCPEAYAKSSETGFRRGDKVKVKGSWAEIDGEDIFIAAKVKKGSQFEFKVRLTSDGMPFWAMSPEQLAKERKGKSK